jgi:two-component system, LytTR family, response regulator LytT
MKIIIIEDEVKAARSLAAMIGKLRPEAEIIAQLQSVESAVEYLSCNKAVDLVFMDIRLSDGICFDIFKAVKLQCPVIFCTAYGEYAMDAIKANGVDYLLKPFSQEQLEDALQRVQNFRNFFQTHAQSDLDNILKKIGWEEGKTSFLVFKNNKYLTLQTTQIAFIYIKDDTSTMMTFQGQDFTVNHSLDQLQGMLSSKQFFRINRQYLINFSAVKEVEHYFARKLFLRLSVPTPEKLLIGKEKASTFLNWLESR